ncbi:hypothetical protein GGX14DRAFT_388991 [Mycena pura]|uniref:Uncharacterized protein n=1 Tax=Mycena pura TaxID=153505 RepID=A0AAD6VWV9_9AGAR|nr:hypothetical protein GGX14DRAFT_388991 [Mycena pura]
MAHTLPASVLQRRSRTSLQRVRAVTAAPGVKPARNAKWQQWQAKKPSPCTLLRVARGGGRPKQNREHAQAAARRGTLEGGGAARDRALPRTPETTRDRAPAGVRGALEGGGAGALEDGGAGAWGRWRAGGAAQACRRGAVRGHWRAAARRETARSRAHAGVCSALQGGGVGAWRVGGRRHGTGALEGGGAAWACTGVALQGGRTRALQAAAVVGVDPRACTDNSAARRCKAAAHMLAGGCAGPLSTPERVRVLTAARRGVLDSGGRGRQRGAGAAAQCGGVAGGGGGSAVWGRRRRRRWQHGAGASQAAAAAARCGGGGRRRKQNRPRSRERTRAAARHGALEGSSAGALEGSREHARAAAARRGALEGSSAGAFRAAAAARYRGVAGGGSGGRPSRAPTDMHGRRAARAAARRRGIGGQQREALEGGGVGASQGMAAAGVESEIARSRERAGQRRGGFGGQQRVSKARPRAVTNGSHRAPRRKCTRGRRRWRICLKNAKNHHKGNEHPPKRRRDVSPWLVAVQSWACGKRDSGGGVQRVRGRHRRRGCSDGTAGACRGRADET